MARCDQVVDSVDVFDIFGVGDLVWNCNQEFTWPGAVELLLIFLTFLVLIFSGTTTKSLLGQVRSSCGCC